MSTEDSFISHLVELRDRLIRALLAVGVVFIVLFLYPGASTIYDLLAQPMLATLPPGTRMIATGVIDCGAKVAMKWNTVLNTKK